jgi:hypothetical protein
MALIVYACCCICEPNRPEKSPHHITTQDG